MPAIPAFASRLIGLLTLITTLLVILRSFDIVAGVDRFIYLPVTLLVLLLTLYVARARQIFVLVAAVLTLANLIWNPAWRETLFAGTTTAAFIAAFFSALTTLKFAAETSPAIQRCGRFLSQQPPGRRYGVLTLGGQLYGLLLNYGAISLLGSMSVAYAALESNTEIRGHRIRRMLLAIQRGFISILSWSPFSFAIAISTSLIPGASWAQAVLPGMISGALLAGIGWLMDSVFKPRLSVPIPPRMKAQDNWMALIPLLLLLLLLVVLLGAAYMVTDVRIQVLIMIIVPCISLGWILVQATPPRLHQTRQRSAHFLFSQLADFRGEMVLLIMAGYLGTVASPLLGSLMQMANLDLSRMPTWSLLVALVWLIPVAGQLGMNPILAAALLAPILPDATTLGVTPAAIVVAITAGWMLSGISSPFTATTLIVGHFAGISSTYVGQRWNGIYTLVCALVLSLWVVIYAHW